MLSAKVMNGIGALALRHGYATLFFYVLASQLGLPLPSVPLLLAAGALAAAGQLGVLPVILSVVVASLCADSVWFGFGRIRGAQVLRLLCRISLEPMVCARIAGRRWRVTASAFSWRRSFSQGSAS